MKIYMKLIIVLMLVFRVLDLTGQNKKIGFDSLQYFSQRFENELSLCIDTTGCHEIYNCYGDTLIKLNNAVLFPDKISLILDSLLKSSFIDTIYLFDANRNIIVNKDLYFFKLSKKLSNKNNTYKSYYEGLIDFKDISTTNVSLINNFCSSVQYLSLEDKIFLLLHFTAIYFIINN